MILANAGGWEDKAWFVGPWNSDVPASISFGGHASPEVHAHDEMFEMYLVAHGSATVVVDAAETLITAGTILVVEPGEVHYFKGSSADYRHFVVQAPFVGGDKRVL